MNTHVVIMAGGIGTRLWPVSTPETPKQFIDLLGVGKSLIQLTDQGRSLETGYFVYSRNGCRVLGRFRIHQ